MGQVDFHYVGALGMTIYRRCFTKYGNARGSEKPTAELAKLVYRTERIFFFLVKQGFKNGYNIGSILEIPDSQGGTCFQAATTCSPKIMKFILERAIKVNTIKLDMQVPAFIYSDLTIQMMKKGINPYVIYFEGRNEISVFPSHFETEKAKSLLATFSRSVHFSIEDIKCEEYCPADCPSQYKRFYYKNEPLVEMTEKNQIGSGGFGSVFQQSFHGIPMAMKCTLLGELNDPEDENTVRNEVNYLERNISELRIQSSIVGPGVIIPVAFVRQQNQEQDENGKWVAENYDIYIYPLYDCNLYELHDNFHDQFSDETLRDILNQCLTRQGSNLVKTAFKKVYNSKIKVFEHP